MISSPNYSKCTVCGIARSKKVHAKCSRKLQKMSNSAKVVAERELAREGERKYNASARLAGELTTKVQAMQKNSM